MKKLLLQKGPLWIFFTLFIFFTCSVAAQSVVPIPKAFMLLSLRNLGGNTLVDGAQAAFHPSYSNLVDYDDAGKMLNGSENVSLLRDGHLLAIERRKNITCNDTLFINITGMRTHQYQWDIVLQNLAYLDRSAFLRDKYALQDIPLNLTGSTPILFSTDANPASYAADRFMIIIVETPLILPVRFTSASAIRNSDKTVSVKWNTENEMNIQSFSIEHSTDGTHFMEIHSQAPAATPGGSALYNYVDTHAISANNYYRISSNSSNGQKQYTPIVKVNPVGAAGEVSIYPNPVTGGNLNLRFANEPTGIYGVMISDMYGRVLHTETVKAFNDNFVQIINLGAKAAPGSYRVTITDVAGQKTSLPFIIQ